MYTIAVIGATGLVGRTMLNLLEERNFPVKSLIPVASQASVGSQVTFKGKQWEVVDIETALALKPDFALFSAGSGVSLEWAPKFAQERTYVIDNSSAWRMDPNVPLLVPEVNASHWSKGDYLIANPNCSTIQAMIALAPIHRKWGIRRLVISTYQSITGTGKAAVDQYNNEKDGQPGNKVYPHQIFANCLPHCDVFMDGDYTREELKLVNETRKILGDPKIAITATAVRVPVYGGHSESINAELSKAFDLEDLKLCLQDAPGLKVLDNPAKAEYPMPLFAEGKNEVFVGRIRRDFSVDNGVNLWVVADNLRKGAATNAVQIAEMVIGTQGLDIENTKGTARQVTS